MLRYFQLTLIVTKILFSNFTNDYKASECICKLYIYFLLYANCNNIQFYSKFHPKSNNYSIDWLRIIYLLNTNRFFSFLIPINRNKLCQIQLYYIYLV